MCKNPSILRKKFLKHAEKNWTLNNHNLKEISAIYLIASYGLLNEHRDIEYIGSTTNLFRRYKTHKVPQKIQSKGFMNILYFLPMKKGFYDYEIKLIRLLKPNYNRQHKNGP